MTIAFCDDCRVGCDAVRMQYLIEVRTPTGETVSIAPTNNAYLDLRDMVVIEMPADVSEAQLDMAPVLLVCDDCAGEREVLRSWDAEYGDVNPDWYKLQIIAKNDSEQPSIAIRVLPYGKKASHLPLDCWNLEKGSFLGGTAFTVVYYKGTRNDTLWFGSEDNTFGFFVKVGGVEGTFPKVMLIEYGTIGSVPFSRN